MKKALLVILTVLLAGLICITVFWDPIIDFLPIDQSGWTEDAGSYRYLDEDGDPVSGWQTLDGKRYFFDPVTCVMQTGWVSLDDGRYFLGADGTMQTGWVAVNGARRYLDSEGRLYSGWADVDGARYYFNEDGIPHTGWLDTEEGKFFLNENGNPHTGWLDTEEGRFFLNENGNPHTGWLETEDGTFFLNENGNPYTGWLETEEGKRYLNENGSPHTGWLDTEDGRYYLDENGIPQTGWLETEEGRFLLNENGNPQTGWLEENGNRYYLLDSGAPAVGHLVIDEQDYYFTSTGANILLVNRWNPVPDGYSTELTTLPNGKEIATQCYDELMQMVEDCKAYGCHPNIIGANRTNGTQRSMFNTRIREYQDKGYNYGTAYSLTIEAVAVPGTSEHELGLAVDIVDVRYPKKYTGEYNCTVWLAEHCWEYGFIPRYPKTKTDITGIKSEPWHYRYVGVELAMEMKDTGLCLEEYLDRLTGDGSTCGNPDAAGKT